ncbi:hypothetical protein [Gryllotalpicola koreensis]|uniref:hypothetical protein n=1 Tax=Gryllotalpicola koreensis TaxID=993086 RepID=UPI0031DAA34E
MSEFTDAQVIAAIDAALRARDMPAVVSLLHVLALQAPTQAQLLADAISLLPSGSD